MLITLQELESILERGVTDIETSDPFQIAAKVNLAFLICPNCGREADLIELGGPEGGSYKDVGNFIKDLGWGFEAPRVEGLFETEPLCPDCMRLL